MPRIVGNYTNPTGFFRGFLHSQGHADGGDCANDGRRPKQPAPMQWGNTHQAKNRKSSQQSRSQAVNPQAAKINHKTENAGEASAFPMGEPRGIHLDHSGRTIGLEVAIDPANGYE